MASDPLPGRDPTSPGITSKNAAVPFGGESNIQPFSVALTDLIMPG